MVTEVELAKISDPLFSKKRLGEFARITQSELQNLIAEGFIQEKTRIRLPGGKEQCLFSFDQIVSAAILVLLYRIGFRHRTAYNMLQAAREKKEDRKHEDDQRRSVST